MLTLLKDSTILIVDDDVAVLGVLARMVRSSGAECMTAETIAAARVLLESEQIQVVITDLNVPGESGRDFVRSLAAERPDVGVMVVSGEDDPKLAAMLIDLGIFGYLTKPFRMNDLVIGVRSALQRRAVQIERREAGEGREEALHREVISRLAAVAELRDVDTGRHIVRMSEYSAAIAKAFGLATERIELIRVASPMHDVGKIGIPDSILLKPGPLTDVERTAMQQHAAIGAEILAHSHAELLSLGSLLALTHHERFDGTGYPRGLAGEAIPIEARIVALADVFDALTSDRIYRGAFAVDEAVTMMQVERGRHFDPAVFGAFLRALPEILAIKESDPGPPERLVAA